MTIRLWLWLVVMDAARLLFGFGSRAYLWALEHAAAAEMRDTER